jgi:hypothetical protein
LWCICCTIFFNVKGRSTNHSIAYQANNISIHTFIITFTLIIKMVSYDPFTPPLTATVPDSSSSPAISPLATLIHDPEAPLFSEVQNIIAAEQKSHGVMTQKEENPIDWHEFDGAECCDVGASVSGIGQHFNSTL